MSTPSLSSKDQRRSAVHAADAQEVRRTFMRFVRLRSTWRCASRRSRARFCLSPSVSDALRGRLTDTLAAALVSVIKSWRCHLKV